MILCNLRAKIYCPHDRQQHEACGTLLQKEANEVEKQKESNFFNILLFARDEWIFLIVALIFALLKGLMFPIFAIIYGSMFQVSNH